MCSSDLYRFGVGTENVDFEYLEKKGIPVYFPGEDAKKVLYDSTANFTLYAILSMVYKDAFGDADAWKKKERDYLGCRRSLVVGTGNIGKRVAERLSILMKVQTYDILTNRADELEGLVRSADIITVHIPLDAATRNFFDGEKLSWMKEDAIIINTARGELFDEDALYDKLNSSRCRAFFDVFWEEPYKGKLKGLGREKFFMTPHSASSTRQFVMEGFKDILRLIEDLLKKERDDT